LPDFGRLLGHSSSASGSRCLTGKAAKALPLPERIHLAEALWESITDEGHEPPLTPAQAQELDRRLEEHRRNPQTGIPWEQVKAELDQKYGSSK
jgi:putative addiction module component (TIGR02574 family)